MIGIHVIQIYHMVHKCGDRAQRNINAMTELKRLSFMHTYESIIQKFIQKLSKRSTEDNE